MSHNEYCTGLRIWFGVVDRVFVWGWGRLRVFQYYRFRLTAQSYWSRKNDATKHVQHKGRGEGILEPRQCHVGAVLSVMLSTLVKTPTQSIVLAIESIIQPQ